jgi:hypothetical protein
VRSAMWANLGFWVLSLGFHSFTPGWLPQQGSFGIFTINQVQQGSRLNNILLPQLAKVYDFDRDGFPLLHGIDCKDWDPHANLLNGGCGGNSTEELKRPSVKRVLRKTSDHVLSAVEKVAKRNRGRNLLLITIDSLRADHLNTYGYPIETAPNLDRLAKKGQVFLNHYTNGASTPISLPVLLHSQSFMDLRTDLPNLVGVLRGKGYRTYHLSDGKYILRNYIFQVEDDLDVINKGNPDQIAQETVNILSRKDDQKKLVWVYLYSLKGSPHHYRTLKVDTPTNRIKLYDKNIRYHDGVVGKILDGLSAKNVLDETVVAFFSDHGEAYMEHGQYHHGYSLYHEHIRTPLILRIPGLPPGKFHFRTSNLDMMPTILQALGLIIPRGLKGISLVEATIDPSIVPERPFYLQSINDYSVIDGRWYLIWNDGLSFELYDEYKDPTHRTNIIRENEEVARSLLLIHQDYFLKARTHIRRDPKFIMKRKQIREILKK